MHIVQSVFLREGGGTENRPWAHLGKKIEPKYVIKFHYFRHRLRGFRIFFLLFISQFKATDSVRMRAMCVKKGNEMGKARVWPRQGRKWTKLKSVHPWPMLSQP